MSSPSNPVGDTPLTTAQTDKQEAQAGKAGYVHRNLIALDMEVAAVFGGANDETISSDAAIAAKKDKGFKGLYGKVMTSFLNLIQRNHGPKAVAGDEQRAQTAAQTEAASGLINQ